MSTSGQQGASSGGNPQYSTDTGKIQSKKSSLKKEVYNVMTPQCIFSVEP